MNKYTKLIELIDTTKRIALIGHNFPDGDCISSMLGLGAVLEKIGKNIKYFVPHTPPSSLSFLKNIKKLNTSFDYGNYDLIIFVDTANPLQLNNFWIDNPKYFEIRKVVSIDHHISNTGYGYFNILDANCSSNAEHIFKIIDKYYRQYIDSDIATTLMTGLTTDTGNFINGNTTKDTFQNASKLLKYGANREIIIKNIFNNNPIETIQITKIILDNIKTYKNTIYSQIDEDIIKNIFTEKENTYKEIKEIGFSIFSSITGFDNYVMLVKMDNMIKGSIRNTQGKSNEIAAKFGGGGHLGRAGFRVEITQDLQTEIDNIIKQISEGV